MENKDTELKQVKTEANRANALAQQAIHDQENLRQKITDQSQQLRDLVDQRTDTLNKNRELVALCRGMESRIREQEQEVMDCKRLIGTEMPLMQESNQKQVKQISQLNDELTEMQSKLRQVNEHCKDLEMINTKLRQQMEAQQKDENSKEDITSKL